MYRFYVELKGLTPSRALDYISKNPQAMISTTDNSLVDIIFNTRLTPREVKQILKEFDPEDFVEITIK